VNTPSANSEYLYEKAFIYSLFEDSLSLIKICSLTSVMGGGVIPDTQEAVNRRITV
jgi:hypothetical protein